MRSMLQLLGGVAVAGAIAAGSTAFTAAGIDKTNLATTAGFLGGQASVTAVGAQLLDVTMSQALNSTPNSANLVSNVVLTFDDATPIGRTVTLDPNVGGSAVAAVGVASPSATGFYCSAVASTVVNAVTHPRSTCTVGETGNHNNGDSFSGLTSVTITVL
jgi:hypothetical protein